MAALNVITEPVQDAPRVVVVGLASCFGCQLQITNAEAHLLDVLGQIDLRYWQLVSSDDMPETFDVAIVEGAVTTQQAVEQLKRVRERAAHVMTIGACAATAGIPGMAVEGFDGRGGQVYEGAGVPAACGDMMSPVPVKDVIEVDSEVLCCPIDPYDFVEQLQKALYGSNRVDVARTMCGECKRNETDCFYNQGRLCLGLVTRAACGARCVNLGRPCNGCAGLSPDANLDAARAACRHYGVPVEDFDQALQMFSQVSLASAREA